MFVIVPRTKYTLCLFCPNAVVINSQECRRVGGGGVGVFTESEKYSANSHIVMCPHLPWYRLWLFLVQNRLSLCALYAVVIDSQECQRASGEVGEGGRRRGSLGKLGHVSPFVSLPLSMADYTSPSRPCSRAGLPEEQCSARGTEAHLTLTKTCRPWSTCIDSLHVRHLAIIFIYVTRHVAGMLSVLVYSNKFVSPASFSEASMHVYQSENIRVKRDGMDPCTPTVTPPPPPPFPSLTAPFPFTHKHACTHSRTLTHIHTCMCICHRRTACIRKKSCVCARSQARVMHCTPLMDPAVFASRQPNRLAGRWTLVTN